MIRSCRTRAAFALALILGAASCASNGPPRRGPGGPNGAAGGASGYIVQPIALLMTDFDRDGDRRVTRDELAAGVEAAWIDADANADGATSVFEFADWARLVMGSESVIPGRVAFDANVDSSVSRAEFVQTLTEEFARLDADEDEILERSELVRFVAPAMQRGGGPPGGGRRAPPPGGERPTPRSTAADAAAGGPAGGAE